MSVEFCRPFYVRAYGFRAGTVEACECRYWVFDRDGEFLGTASTRKRAGYMLEQDVLARMYCKTDVDNDNEEECPC
jgi:hypothetical protein